MKKSKVNKSILIVLCLSMLLILVWKIVDTYAVFQSQTDGSMEFKKGIWNITVNGEQITEGLDTQLLIDNLNIRRCTRSRKWEISTRAYRIF